MFLFKSLNFLMDKLFNAKIVLGNSYKANRIAKRIFSKSSLVQSENGYFFLDPMPTEKDLEKYYTHVYWNSREPKDKGANLRDFAHFLILKNYVPRFFNDKTLLNFGSGHGGLSHLAWNNGLNVINVDPSPLPDYYNKRWTTYSSINEVPDNSIDILYGSHSLEHVQDLSKFLAEAKRVLKVENLVFFEVPNANCESNGAMRGKIDIPHTYYFTTQFFENCFDFIHLNEVFDKKYHLTQLEDWESAINPQGSVIRFLGGFLK